MQSQTWLQPLRAHWFPMPTAPAHPRTSTSWVWWCTFSNKTLPFGKRPQTNYLSSASMCNLHCGKAWANVHMVLNIPSLILIWRTIYVLEISHLVPKFLWISTSLQSTVDFLWLEGKRSCHGNFAGVLCFTIIHLLRSWFATKFCLPHLTLLNPCCWLCVKQWSME